MFPQEQQPRSSLGPMLFYYSVFNTGRRCKLYPGVSGQQLALENRTVRDGIHVRWAPGSKERLLGGSMKDTWKAGYFVDMKPGSGWESEAWHLRVLP